MAANAIYLSNDKTVHDFAISNCWRTPQHWIIRIHFITGKDWLPKKKKKHNRLHGDGKNNNYNKFKKC